MRKYRCADTGSGAVFGFPIHAIPDLQRTVERCAASGMTLAERNHVAVPYPARIAANTDLNISGVKRPVLVL